MFVVYSKDNCPACDRLKYKLKSEGKPFVEKKIGKDIPVEEFLKKYPDVKVVPFYVEEN